DGRPLVAGESPLEQLQRWSQEHVLYCPNCRGVVHVRGGPEKRTQLHFAHQKGECAWSTESESVRHMRGKMVLAGWLRKQFHQAVVTLEERQIGRASCRERGAVSVGVVSWEEEGRSA